jgi:anti-anti-sigma regulatory factor
MLLDTGKRGRFGIVRILEDLTIHTDPGPLKKIVEDYAARGTFNVAFSFTPGTFPSSRLMAILVSSREILRKHNGKLAIINPNEKMIDTFNVLNLAHGDFFLLVDTEEELDAHSPMPEH